jgi:hypothetical protein
MVLYPTEHRNDNNIGSMYHSSATSRTTSSRLRNRVVIIARRADRAAVICCCWVARRAVTCMRPLSSQHSIAGPPSQSCMMRCTALHDSSAHRMSRRPQGGCEGEWPARKATGSTTYCTWGGAGARRLGARSLHSAPGSSPTCDASPNSTTPVLFGVCDACAVAGARRDKHSDPVSPRLQPASFVRPSSPARSTPRGRTSAGQHRPVCKQTGPFWMPARIARQGHERGRGQQQRDPRDSDY